MDSRTQAGAHAAPFAPPTPRTRIGVALMLVASACLYGLGITRNGMANTFYAGAAWAATKSWKALLFGSVDPANLITVDKPPLSQWVMGLSCRLFGFSSASMLVPEAVMGVTACWLTYATATRLAGRTAGFVAGLALAFMPVADLMFRFNNPDAAMVLCMVAGAYCTVRAVERGSGWWLALAGTAMGTAFLAKMLEGLMSLPALVVLYLLAAPVVWRRKLLHLAGAALAVVVSAGWYVVLTILWPSSSRPYLAGSSNNTFLNLVFGYNGLARVQGRASSGGQSGGRTGSELASRLRYDGLSRGSGFAGMGSRTGLLRLVTGEFGLEVGWLIPAALVALVFVLVLRGRRPVADLPRAGALMAAIWLLVDGGVLSFMQGTTHAYYSLSVAPAIALLVGIGAAVTWQARHRFVGGLGVAAITCAAAGFGAWLVATGTSGWRPWLAWLVATLAVVASALTVTPLRRALIGTAASGVAITALVAGLGAPAAVAVQADMAAHTGSSPSVAPRGISETSAILRSRDAGGSGRDSGGDWMTGAARWGAASMSADARAGAGFGASANDPQLDALLEHSHATWAGAVSGTEAAAGLELQARVAVMGIGGFTGSDPVPTLAAFESDVAAHRVGYYVVEGGSASGGWEGDDGSGRSSSSVQAQVKQWVEAHFTAQRVGSVTVYDLAGAHTA